MNWDTLFTHQQEISADDARELINDRPPGSLQVLDVRQPAEYKEFHLPGAILVPLNSLSERIDELNPASETVVYCRSGARSNAASQFLRNQGFAKVLNMRGGIIQWQGEKATGGEKQGLDYFITGTYDSAFTMAYSMEAGLQQFYQILARSAKDPEVAELLDNMAAFEEGHMAKLAAQYRKIGGEIDPEAITPIPEGGLTMEDLWANFGDQLATPAMVIQLAMGFEAQAYDLYIRLARKNQDSELYSFYQKMAEEEKKHLNRLTGELDHLLATA
jgi:rhodanese-related sulfurtransferase/rubrerythrin